MSPLGDSAVIIQLGEGISEQTHRVVSALTKRIENDPFPGFIECVPAFTSVTVFYQPFEVYRKMESGKAVDSPYEKVKALIEHHLQELTMKEETNQRTVEIPVCYGGRFGPDLEEVADINGLTAEEVIDIHTSGEYLVYMIGFAPGFPYLGGMSEKIAAPRRSSPRTSIPAGSVGIAGMQTGVYPLSTPGGWQLIGNTPLELFKPYEQPPSLLRAGDIVKFVSVTEEEYHALKEGKS
ncbi:5-oxoprolinase subunit PxpB [Bacillus haynesii]|uniref:5-oxoprolinase subunit PxpB n=1 Tax=Bacillus haynesii TaxID=1925021 RepID=UPI002282437C|nr:5-oxoprolinase subunit PxpB [Bacillus haynesii]MCY7792031.1 5-oxoprolinase subunit PxpB [Bacillus haynesii]MCY8757165.1 5-oxoprolinase subunit PxpB [Bacillus haynesii]MCY9391919.1 5-oxoprolinase subunit PxpB [Bacillus haynesii]MEC0707231.1 5-oxoprolinase subunit PxpB [Bacillus haynesii]MEC0719401.1 5-oxoprolinase subunit PxpB [Bacillus haynesii]